MPEYVVAVGVGSVVTIFAVTLVVHSGRTFASLANYADLNSSSLLAIDRMTREIRNSAGVVSFDAHKIVLNVATNETVTFAYSSADKTLTRQKDASPPSTLLTGCDSLEFFVYEPAVEPNTLALQVTASTTNAKAIGVTWLCTRSILGRKANTDSPRTATVVMRKP